MRALVRRSSDLSSLRPRAGGAELAHGLEFVYGDITGLESLVKACDGCEALFHVAALVEPWLPDPSRFYSVSFGLYFKSNFRDFRGSIRPRQLIHAA